MMQNECRVKLSCVAVINSSETLPDLVKGDVVIPGLPNIRFSDILEVSVTCPQVASEQFAEFTPAAFDRGDCCDDTDTYWFTVETTDCEGRTQRQRYTETYTRDRTAAEITNDFVAKINSDVVWGGLVTASNSSNKIRIEADTTGFRFVITGFSSNFTLVQQAGSFSFGQGADLELEGVEAGDIIADAVYTGYDITFLKRITNEDGVGLECDKCYQLCEKTCRVYVEDAADTESFVTALCDIFDGTHSPTSDYLAKLISCDCVEIANGCPDLTFSYTYSASGDTLAVTNTTTLGLDTVASVSIDVNDGTDTLNFTSFGAGKNVSALDAGEVHTITVTVTFASGCVEVATATTSGAVSGNLSGTGT